MTTQFSISVHAVAITDIFFIFEICSTALIGSLINLPKLKEFFDTINTPGMKIMMMIILMKIIMMKIMMMMIMMMIMMTIMMMIMTIMIG
jgi:hypothetical protein